MQIQKLKEMVAPYAERFPVLSLLADLIAESGIDLEIRPCTAGLEFRMMNQVQEMPNRGWLRIFFPNENKCVLFFHKKSSIPFSRDRFSYGGVVIDERSTSRFHEEDVKEWINFLKNGLSPQQRPRSLKKSFPYTVPED